ncbi:PEP-CTERM sorting domain-containing protein [Tunturiibacter psychrotolerans]|uniref:PEP-CTERM sorting domain-containing protein n=1 Tax=Tunturiibacter psychrotolerans TaxID=3069686 RepID=UPI003D1DF066
MPYVLSADDTTIFGTEFESANQCETDGSATCSAQSLFFNTATIDSITVENANGSPVSGATVTSLAGIDYNASPVGSTPEPSSILLLGTGVISIAALIRRRLSIHSNS